MFDDMFIDGKIEGYIGQRSEEELAFDAIKKYFPKLREWLIAYFAYREGTEVAKKMVLYGLVDLLEKAFPKNEAEKSNKETLEIAREYRKTIKEAVLKGLKEKYFNEFPKTYRGRQGKKIEEFFIESIEDGISVAVHNLEYFYGSK